MIFHCMTCPLRLLLMIYPATFNIIIHGREVVRAAGMLIPELIRLAELADNLTKLKAVESTISTPETSKRCEPTSMIEPSVSRILGI